MLVQVPRHGEHGLDCDNGILETFVGHLGTKPIPQPFGQIDEFQNFRPGWLGIRGLVEAQLPVGFVHPGRSIGLFQGRFAEQFLFGGEILIQQRLIVTFNGIARR